MCSKRLVLFFINPFMPNGHVRIQRGGGGRGSGPPMVNYKNVGFLSNTGPDPLKITKLPNQYSMLGHHRPASETPFRWRAFDCHLIVDF